MRFSSTDLFDRAYNLTDRAHIMTMALKTTNACNSSILSVHIYLCIGIYTEIIYYVPFLALAYWKEIGMHFLSNI